MAAVKITLSGRKRVDLSRGVARTKAIINIHDRHAAAATVQHPEQRRETAKARAVTNAGRNGNHGLRNQTSDDARQGAFHAGNDNDNIRAAESFQTIKEPVNPGDADIANALDPVAHNLSSNRCFLGYRQIARARARNGNGPANFSQRLFFDGNAAGQLVMDGVFEFFAQNTRVFRRNARGENVLAVVKKLGGDFEDLVGRFARAKNHFGKTLAQCAMSIDLSEPDIGNRRRLEGSKNAFAIDRAGAELLQELIGFGYRHGATMPQKRRRVTWESEASRRTANFYL